MIQLRIFLSKNPYNLTIRSPFLLFSFNSFISFDISAIFRGWFPSHPWNKKYNLVSVRVNLILTGIEEDHCLDTQILLVLQFQLSEPRGHGQEHIKDLQNSLYAFPLIPMETYLKCYRKSRIKELWLSQIKVKAQRRLQKAYPSHLWQNSKGSIMKSKLKITLV